MNKQNNKKWLLSALLLTALGVQYFYSYQPGPEGTVHMSSLGDSANTAVGDQRVATPTGLQMQIAAEPSQDPLVISSINSAFALTGSAVTESESALRDVESARDAVRARYMIMKGTGYQLIDKGTELATKAMEMSTSARSMVQLAARVATREAKFAQIAQARVKAAEAMVAAAEARVAAAEGQYAVDMFPNAIGQNAITTARTALTEARLNLSRERANTEANAMCPSCGNVNSYADFQAITEALYTEDCASLDLEDQRRCMQRRNSRRRARLDTLADSRDFRRIERRDRMGYRDESRFTSEMDRVAQECQQMGNSNNTCFSNWFVNTLRTANLQNVDPAIVQDAFNRYVRPQLANLSGYLSNPATHAYGLETINQLTTGIPAQFDFINTQVHQEINRYKMTQATAASRGTNTDRMNLYNTLNNIGTTLLASPDASTQNFARADYVPSIRSLFPNNSPISMNLSALTGVSVNGTVSQDLSGGQVYQNGVGTRSGVVRGANVTTLPSSGIQGRPNQTGNITDTVQFGAPQQNQRGTRGSY